MNYGQNRASFHNAGHNMHNNHGPNNVANISTSQPQPQPQPANINNKLDTNISVQPQSNSQQRFKTMDPTNLTNQQQQKQQQQQHQQQQHASQKSSIKMTSNSETVLSRDIMEMNDGCGDEHGALNVIATSNTSSKTKTPMCLINELVRANQVRFMAINFGCYFCYSV